MPKFADKITPSSAAKVNMMDSKYLSLFNDGGAALSALDSDVTANTSFLMDIPKDVTEAADNSDAQFTFNSHGFNDGDEVYYGSAEGDAKGTYFITQKATNTFKLMTIAGVVLLHSQVSSNTGHYVGDHPDTRRNINGPELREYMQTGVQTSSAADAITSGTGEVTITTSGSGANDGDINITPGADGQIVLDSTIEVDAGVITGATSITSTDFVGALTGDVAGNLTGQVSTVSQSNITTMSSLTSVGALATGSIATGFGVIDTASAITTTAAITGGSIVVGDADISEADLEKIDGITNGTSAFNKALVLDGSGNLNSGLLNSITMGGTLTAETAVVTTASSGTGNTQMSYLGLHAIHDDSFLTVGRAAKSGALTDSNFYTDLNIQGNTDTDAVFSVSNYSGTEKFSVAGATGNVVSKGEINSVTYKGGTNGTEFTVAADGNLVCNDINIQGSFSLSGAVTVVNGSDTSTTNDSFLLKSGATSANDASGSFFGVETNTDYDPKVKWSDSHTMGCGWKVSNHGANANENEERHILTASTHAGIPTGEVEGTTGVPYNLSDGMIVIDTSNDDIYMYFA